MQHALTALLGALGPWRSRSGAAVWSGGTWSASAAARERTMHSFWLAAALAGAEQCDRRRVRAAAGGAGARPAWRFGLGTGRERCVSHPTFVRQSNAVAGASAGALESIISSSCRGKACYFWPYTHRTLLGQTTSSFQREPGKEYAEMPSDTQVLSPYDKVQKWVCTLHGAPHLHITEYMAVRCREHGRR
jgi:hypothetical protein